MIESVVDMTELLGADSNLYLSSGEIQLTAVIPTGTTGGKMGDKIKVCLDTRKLHIFDYDTEKAITN